VLGNATVTIYWPYGAPPSTVAADANGEFSLTIDTGTSTYTDIELTQMVNGKESARVRIPAS